MKNTSFLLIFLLYLLAIPASAQQKSQFVKLETEQGSCIIKLYNETPVHRDNFIKLVKKHYFDKTTFNRILKGFVIQGGDPDSLYEKGNALRPEQKWIAPEFNANLFHKRGVIAMGRDDNQTKKSFSTQIYIVDGRTYTDAQLDVIEKRNGNHFTDSQRETYRSTGGTPSLDQNYTVFGEIVEGMDLIDKLVAVKVNKAGNPEKEVWMKIRLLKTKEIRTSYL